MRSVVVLPGPASCATAEFGVAVFCLPLAQDCTLPDDDITQDPNVIPDLETCPCEECQCLLEGDPLDFQTRFADTVNADISNPTLGVGTGLIDVNILDGNGALVSSDVGSFTTGTFAGFNGENTLQVTNLDTAAISTLTGGGIFSVRFTGEGGSVQSQCFEFVDETCEPTVTIRSEYDGEDCFGNDYSITDFNNQMRLCAQILDGGGNVQKTRTGKKITFRRAECRYRIVMTRPITVRQKNILLKLILMGDRVYVNDELVEIDSFTVNNLRNENSACLQFEIPFQFSCEIRGNGSCNV